MFCFRKPALTLDTFRKILTVAKRDEKNYEEGLWWADLVTNMCGVKNTVRDDIARRKPSTNRAIVSANERIVEIKENADKEKDEILGDATKKADDLRKRAHAIETMANLQANQISSKTSVWVAEKQERIKWAKNELEDISEIEYIIAKGLAEK